MLKVNYFFIILFLLCAVTGKVMAQDSLQLLTLFTTAEERQVINNNRYKGDKPVQKSTPQPEPERKTEEFRDLVKEEVSVSYMISGVSTSAEGGGTAWVNGKPYESGEVMDDGSKIRIKKSTVIITTADGKNYSAVSGEVLDLTYLRTAKE